MWVLNLPFLWCRLGLPLWGLSLGSPLWSPPTHPQIPTGSATQLPCPDAMFDETVTYDPILQLVFVSLNRPDLYTQEVRHP